MSDPKPQLDKQGGQRAGTEAAAESHRTGSRISPNREADSEASAGLAADRSAGRSGRMLFFAAFLALLWIVALIFLAEFTANPVTLNQDQIRRSPVIVSVEILDLEKSRVSVQKVWRGTELSGEIVVENLKETAVSPQQRFILPLSAVAGDKRRFRVTGSLVPSSAAEPEKMKLLVYPENEESIRQLQEILAREAEHPDP